MLLLLLLLGTVAAPDRVTVEQSKWFSEFRTISLLEEANRGVITWLAQAADGGNESSRLTAPDGGAVPRYHSNPVLHDGMRVNARVTSAGS